ncbi:DUF4352 domain-containing protein [Listeria rocourtiae]|uniref:DUF4352 domain-containing protein n=1 Tax=Listeria rocourtiae TaxID=647910 RepID=UPI0016250BC2|nr:DUF4352 domain-containing protein [Listeria rocourtiae]MBC1605519.1 DUF4352 domain-containing protein [Listeria rocourtiae]
MKKSKHWLAILIFSCALVAVGCGKVKSDDIGKTRTINDLEITVTNIEMQNSNNSGKQIAKIDFSIKNIGKEESGAGAGDFVIQTKNEKKHPVYGLNANNFGDVIPTEKTLKGAGYYEIPAGQKEITVLYEPRAIAIMESVSWVVNIPAK